MFSIPSWAWKLVAGLALVVVAFFIGSSHGYNSGYSTGFDKGKASTQGEIQQLTDKINKDAKDHNDKVTQLEQQAATAEGNVQHWKDLYDQKSGDVIIKWKQANPTIINTCAIAKPTVDALNELIDGANAYTASSPGDSK